MYTEEFIKEFVLITIITAYITTSTMDYNTPVYRCHSKISGECALLRMVKPYTLRALAKPAFTA